MRLKYLAPLMATLLLISPVFAFWHPPDEIPPCPTFGIMINGQWAYNDKLRYNFIEPFDNFCDNVTIEVFVINVTDLYAYEFELYWNSIYFRLLHYKVEHIHAADYVVLPVPEEGGPANTQPYKQVVTAKAPAPGFTGNGLVATLTFHIYNDVCWSQKDDPVDWFCIVNYKMSNSCGGDMEPCLPLQGLWRFKAVQPRIYLLPPEEVNCKVGDKFTMSVWVENITKMRSIHFELDWNWRAHNRWLKDGTLDSIWLELLTTKVADVTINEAVFPTASRTPGPWVTVTLGAPVDRLNLDITMKGTYPLINGTFKVADIVFTKKDPWYCGRQPIYRIDTEEHLWIPENATTDIWFKTGYFDVECPGPANILFGTDYGVTKGIRGYALYDKAIYTFMPVPGDLDGSGKVDITDLMIIAGYYGWSGPPAYPYNPPWDGPAVERARTYYDFTQDCIVDIFDIVLVAKNFDRECP